MNREREMTTYVQWPQGRGFTIVELLVVIAVIGILMGLLLPAIQAARESGRRTACMSNAYQLGMAVNRFDQDKGRVPRWQDMISSTPLYVSWPVVLLPYLERNDLYDLWSAGTATDSKVGLFLCPSSPPVENNPAPLAYAGNAGDGSGTTLANGVMPPIGIGYSLEDIADGDGTSTTMLFAEKSATFNSQRTWATSEYQSRWSYPGSNTGPQLFSFQNNPVPDPSIFLPEIVPAGNCQQLFPLFGHGSPPTASHLNGSVVAFCDGHTHFLKDDVSSSVYTQLITSRNSAADSAYRSAVLDESQY